MTVLQKEAKFLRSFVLYPLSFVGFGIVDRKGELAGRRTTIFSLSYLFVTLSLFLYTVASGAIQPSHSFNVISSTAFWTLFYTKFFVLTFVLYSTLRNRKKLYRHYRNYLEILNEFKNCNLNIYYPFKSLLVWTIFVNSFLPLVLAVDIYKLWDDFSFPTLFCVYVPDFALGLYMNLVIAFFEGCNSRFIAINHYLAQFTMTNLTASEMIMFTLKNLEPPINLTSHTNGTRVKDLFVLHNKLYKLVKGMNNITGIELLGYLALAALAILCFMYTLFMDLIRFRLGKEIKPKPFFATDFSTIIYITCVLRAIYASNQLMKNSGNTSNYLHAIRSVYPKFGEVVRIYSLQLLQQEIVITAAGFFVLDFGALYGFTGSLATYLFILVQLDRGVEE